VASVSHRLPRTSAWTLTRVTQTAPRFARFASNADGLDRPVMISGDRPLTMDSSRLRVTARALPSARWQPSRVQEVGDAAAHHQGPLPLSGVKC
jgi:hypothetical protein